MNGMQCSRLLWHAEKKLLPKLDLSTEQKFAAGHEFEEYVKLLYPKGIDVTSNDFMGNIKNTKKLVEEKATIFEAGFIIDGLYVRSDLIIPNKDMWDLYEIKSSTEAKDVHVTDLAFQKYVLEKSGLKVNKSFVIHLNKEYIKKGKINPKKLVKIEEVTNKVNTVGGFKENIEEFKKIMQMPEYTDLHISQNCNKPYSCPLKKECWETLPKNHVLQLTNWRVYWNLFHNGIIELEDVPEDTRLNEKELTIIKALKKNPQINKTEIKRFLNKLNYPLYHFDFETFDTAIPIYNQSKPYQKIPFQYSLHIEQKNGKIEHKEFLATGKKDPRIELLKQMKSDLKGKGDIIVFNKSFEISVMKKLSEDFPENKKWLYQAMDRIIDLAEPFQKFHYYNKKQKGSYSIKKVLPAITGKSYSELEINNGADASMLYFYTHIKPNKKLNKKKIRENLLKYCGLDTEAMIWIINELEKQTKN
jgi:hypothetical protein